MKSLFIVALLVALSGCGSLISEPLPEDAYFAISKIYYQTYTCGKTGMLSSDIVASGLNSITNKLSTYRYDRDKFNNELHLRHGAVSQEECNVISISIKQGQSKQISNATVQYYQPTIPITRHTYCNQIGTQTLCSTY